MGQAKLQAMIDQAQEELTGYLSLPPAWDGYNGLIFERNLVKKAQALALEIHGFFSDHGLDSPSEITPGPASDGSLDLEVVLNERKLIITLYPNENEANIYFKNGQTVYEKAYPLNDLDLEEKLNWLSF